MCNNHIKASTSHTAYVTAHMDATTSHIETVTAHMEDATANIKATLNSLSNYRDRP